MTCLRCRGPMTSARATRRYVETGLSNVVLVNVEVRTCSACGERELVTPRVEVLHCAIAQALSRQTAPLSPEAVRFLRKWLGMTVHGFAGFMGVRPETVFRWERAGGATGLPPPADRLLKLLVAQHNSATAFPVDQLMRARGEAEPIVLMPSEVESGASGWLQHQGTDALPVTNESS